MEKRRRGEGKRGRESEKEREKEKEEEEEEKIENRKSDTKKRSSLSTPLSPDASFSPIPSSDEARE